MLVITIIIAVATIIFSITAHVTECRSMNRTKYSPSKRDKYYNASERLWMAMWITLAFVLLFIIITSLTYLDAWNTRQDLTVDYCYLSEKAEKIDNNSNYLSQVNFFTEVDNYNKLYLSYCECSERWYNWLLYPSLGDLPLIEINYGG